jgi:hypothetical protein
MTIEELQLGKFKENFSFDKISQLRDALIENIKPYRSEARNEHIFTRSFKEEIPTVFNKTLHSS